MIEIDVKSALPVCLTTARKPNRSKLKPPPIRDHPSWSGHEG
jgi:hypothetical protein